MGIDPITHKPLPNANQQIQNHPQPEQQQLHQPPEEEQNYQQPLQVDFDTKVDPNKELKISFKSSNVNEAKEEEQIIATPPI